MREQLRSAPVPAYICLCLLLGGASAAGHWANLLLQALGIALLFWAVLVNRDTVSPRPARQLVLLGILVLLLIVLQLVPLPGSLWTSLPGRAQFVPAYQLLNQPLPSLPISLAPEKTLASALWLLPAVAVFFGMTRLGYFKASWIAAVMAIIAVLSAMLGVLQVGGGSSWYIYKVSNFGAGTGFFANANHTATLFVATIPMLGALYAAARARSHSAHKMSVAFVMVAGALAVILVGVAVNRSLAGIGLAVPSAAATFIMIRYADRKVPLWIPAALALVAAAAVLLVFQGPFDNDLTQGKGTLSREASFRLSLAAAKDFFPFGSGIGTFQDIFPSYEDPNGVTRTYFNHVHSDFIEIAMETGILGVLLIALFLLWWSIRVFRIWTSEKKDYFACAATIASGVILAHSAVDYPLRTAAISAIFAACCALMADVRPRPTRGSSQKRRRSGARHLDASEL